MYGSIEIKKQGCQTWKETMNGYMFNVYAYWMKKIRSNILLMLVKNVTSYYKFKMPASFHNTLFLYEINYEFSEIDQPGYWNCYLVFWGWCWRSRKLNDFWNIYNIYILRDWIQLHASFLFQSAMIFFISIYFMPYQFPIMCFLF